jgi:hypothetical protein
MGDKVKNRGTFTPGSSPQAKDFSEDTIVVLHQLKKDLKWAHTRALQRHQVDPSNKEPIAL